MNVEIRKLTAADVRTLRGAVLRPGQPPETLIYPGDDAPETLHVGAHRGGELVAVASIYREPLPSEGDDSSWRLRGMATLPHAQRRGFGSRLIEHLVTHIADVRGSALWCNARTSAAGFYRRSGFEVRGDEFDLPGIGPHFVMWRRVG